MDRWTGRTSRRDEPFSWWGYRTGPAQPLSIVELIDRGSLDARTAAFLWLAIERRASLVVAATPPQAGKTTTLTALLDFLPAGVEPIFLRGWYERFAFLQTTSPERAYLLCNEISAHLPTYLWGRGVRRLFEAMRDGYGMATTMHAEGAAAVLDLLAAFPLEVPRSLLGGIDLVVTLGVATGVTGPTRRVVRVEAIAGQDGCPAPETIAARETVLAPLDAPAGRLVGCLTSRLGMQVAEATAELARRERALERLRAEGTRDIAAVRAALRAVAGGDGARP